MTDKYSELRAALEAGPSLGKWYRDGVEVFAEGCEFHPIAVCARHPSCEPEEICEANASLISACHPETIRALLAERDALAEAVDCLHAFAGRVAPSASFWDDTWPKLDAAIARAALAQEQGGSDAGVC